MWRYDPWFGWQWYRLWFYATVALLLSGCISGPVVKPVTTACPAIPTYTADWQAKFADELAMVHARGDAPHVEAFVVDAVRTRQELKTCQPVQ